MQLARELHMSRARLLQEVDSEELTDWLAFYSMEQDKKQGTAKDKSTVLKEKFGSIMAGKIKKKVEK